jgi:hypothetical protein
VAPRPPPPPPLLLLLLLLPRARAAQPHATPQLLALCSARPAPRRARGTSFAAAAAAPMAAHASSASASLRVRVRPYEPRDGPAVRAFWRAGFLEMAWDVTRTLGPLGGPDLAVPVRRSRVLRFAFSCVFSR